MATGGSLQKEAKRMFLLISPSWRPRSISSNDTRIIPLRGIEHFPRFIDFTVCALDREEIYNFVTLMVDNVERRNRILHSINNPVNEDYFEYLQVPLLLSMFVLVFENHPEIPRKKSAFYRNVFDTLYSKHDGINKNSFTRERRTGLQREDFKEVLSLFSFSTLTEGQYSYTYEMLTDTFTKVKGASKIKYDNDSLVYDLHTSISILILDGFEYRFPHLSMQ